MLGALRQGNYSCVTQKGRRIWAAHTQILLVSLIFFSSSERIEGKVYEHKLLNRYTWSVKVEKWHSGENIKPDSESENIKYYLD